MGHSTKSKRKAPPVKRKEGRRSLYDPLEHPALARRVMGEGKTLGELAVIMEVDRSTMDEWRERHPEFSGMVKLGQMEASDKVERALFERAVGFRHPTVKPMVVSGGQGMGSSIEMVNLTEQYPPDTAAALAWLKNKRPAEWKDKQHVEHSGTLTLEQILAAASAPPEKPERDHG